MGIQILLGNSALKLNLSGGTAITNLRKQITIPYASIITVHAGSFNFPLTSIKILGIAGIDHKAGHFVINGDRYFLSYYDSNEVVIIDLDDHEFHKIVIQNEDPKQLVNDILQHIEK